MLHSNNGGLNTQTTNHPLNLRDIASLLFIFIIIAMIFLCFIFLPTIVIPFVHHDDYFFFISHDRTGYFSHPSSAWVMRLGRIFHAVINSIYDQWIDTIPDLSIFRAISILFTAISLAIFALWLRLLNFSKIVAFFTSVCVFTLPGAQVYIFWVICSPFAIAVFFALLSAILIEQVEPKALLRLKTLNLRTVIFVILSFIGLFISINTYQVSAMFYLLPTLAIVLFNEQDKWSDTRLKVIRSLALFCVVLLTYFFVHRLITLPYLMAHDPDVVRYMSEPSMYQFKITSNIYEKANFFINNISFQSLNLWNIYPNYFIAYLVALIILTGMVFAGIPVFSKSHNRTKMQAVGSIIQITGVVCLLMLLANTPNLLAVGGYPAYRTLFPYSAMIVLLVVWSLQSLTLFLPEKWRTVTIGSVTGLMLLVAGFSAQYNMLMSVLNANLELSFMRAKVAEHINNNKNLTGIHVIRREGDLSFLGLPGRHDEFNVPSSAFPQDIWVMIQSFLRVGEKNKDGLIVASSFPTVTNSSSDDSSLVYISSDKILIDMNDLLLPIKRKIYKSEREIATITVSGAGPRHGGGRAFDGSNEPDSFWEVGCFSPQWIQLEYSRHKKITRYELQTGEGVERSPKAWQFQGSNDGVKWVDLDERKNQVDWRLNEKRIYNIQNPSDYKYYRFIFTEGNDPILRIYEIRMIYDSFPTKKHEKAKVLIDTNVNYSPILVKEGYLGFNILLVGNKYYGIGQEEGKFDVRKVNKKGYKRLVEGRNIEEVKSLIREG